MSIENTIAEFKKYTDKFVALNMACGMFSWDMATGAPKGGNRARAVIMSVLAGEAFSLSISDEMKGYIDELEAHASELDEITSVMLKYCKKAYHSYRSIPVAEFMAYSELTSNSQNIWEEAKENNDFSFFKETLDKIIKYGIKFIGYRGYKVHPYNCLLDDYEEGLTVEQLDVFFSKMKQTIVPLLKRIQTEGKKPDTSFTTRYVSKEKQQKISELLLRKVGFDYNRGMLKESAHPFTMNFTRDDVRITTHYRENMFLSSFFSVLHEYGHSLYEQSKRDDIAGTMLDSGVSMGIHESQSRFFENIIGRSLEFWQNIYDELMEILGDDFRDITPEMFCSAVNVAEPSLIRTEADELTYSLHIMIRYEIEKMLISGEYNIDELPVLWNKKYEEYLGITPGSDAEGILQDVHWSGGMIGYFPSYSLGNAYAAQIYSFMQKDLDVLGLVRKGDFGPIKDWLKEKIHQYGSLKTPDEIITAISGEKLNADYYVKYLEDKYTKVYGLN